MLNPVNDADWAKVLAPETTYASQKEAEKKYSGLTTENWQELRFMAKHDLFYLVNSILGYDRLSPRLHGHLCGWLRRNAEARFREVLLPRGHFKTTIVTIGDAIQTALSGGDELAWPRNLGPNARILLAHETDKGASRFLYEITSHFTSNPALMGLFPELVPSARLQRMNQNELELPRDLNAAEPTFDTMGVGAKGQGRHYNMIKLDDLFGDKARDSAAERETTLQWFDNIQSFFSKFSQDIFDLVGTRYSIDDLYGHAHKMYGPQLLRYIRRIEEYSEVEKKLVAIFPEEFTPESLSILRRNPKVWAQYTNDPREGITEFLPEWKRFYHWAGPRKIVFFTGRHDQEHPTTYDVRQDLDIVILVDPAMSGKPGIVVTGTDRVNRVFVLEAIKKPMRPDQFCQLIFNLVQKWWPRLVNLESVVFSGVYKNYFESEMKLRNIRFHINLYKPPKSKVKLERVRGLANYFSSGQIWFNEGQIDLIEEYDNLGATEDYHMLDAMAQGPEVWRPFYGKTQETARRKEQDRLKQRDAETGY